MRSFKNIVVTGGAGFIGSNFIRYILNDKDFSGRVINVDKLTYAGNLASLEDVYKNHNGDRYFFEQADICDAARVREIYVKYDVDAVVHLAAESHVDRSIEGPGAFIQTNVLGTYTLLEEARQFWGDRKDVLFHHVSTDEVFGSLGDEGFFYEDTPYDPRSPYSASKASSDHIVRAYFHTFNLPITMSNCSNNYGPYQFPEKLIPVMILNMKARKTLPVYGDGANIRDWLYVEDHNSAVWLIMKKGRLGESYNIGGENEWRNLQLVETLCDLYADTAGVDRNEIRDLITFVKDRPGHDQRYAINCDRLKNELGWKQSLDFENGLKETLNWYLNHSDWIESIQTGEYKSWMEKNYAER